LARLLAVRGKYTVSSSCIAGSLFFFIFFLFLRQSVNNDNDDDRLSVNCVYQVLTFLLVVGMTLESTPSRYSSTLMRNWMIFISHAQIHCASAERWRENEAILCLLFSEEECASEGPERKLITGSMGCPGDVAMVWADLMLTVFIGC